jgi:hypothetical protein
MLSKLPSQNFKLCSKQYNEIILLHLIVAPQLGGSSLHNYSTKTRQEGHANDQAMYSLMSISSLALFISIVFAVYFLIHPFNNILSLLLCFLYAIFPFSYVSFYYFLFLFLFLSPFSFFPSIFLSPFKSFPFDISLYIQFSISFLSCYFHFGILFVSTLFSFFLFYF